ncbi:MAG: metal-dependent transcriptional regulator [Bacillota bacterium]
MPSYGSISPSLEDYLEAVWDLCGSETDGVRTTDIAMRLGVSKSSVNQAMASLAERGLVQQERYGPVVLTEAGCRYAKMVRNRHSTIKRFLVSTLGVDDSTAELDACKIEHVLSPKTMDALIEFMEGRGKQDDAEQR